MKKGNVKKGNAGQDLIKRFFKLDPPIQIILDQDAEVLHKKYPEVNKEHIAFDLFYFFEVILLDLTESEYKRNDIKNLNNWFDFDSAVKLGYKVDSITILLKKDHATEKIRLSLDDTRIQFHSKLIRSILEVHKQVRPLLGKTKINKLPSMRVGGVKKMGGKGRSRASDLKIILGSKERTYNYFYDLICSDMALLQSTKHTIFNGSDTHKMLRNYLGKF